MKTRKIVDRLIREEWAQDLAEYGFALGIIGTGAATAAVGFAAGVNSVWESANAAIGDAVTLIAGS